MAALRKSTCETELGDNRAVFPKTIFNWKTDKLWFFRFGYVTDIFLKINDMILSFQEKQLVVCVANDNIELSSKN